jgi:hypothetical protein
MKNVGQHVEHFYTEYCRCHRQSSNLVTSSKDAHPGIGTLEKSQEREERVFREKAEEVAKAMWREAGEPSGGHYQFLERASSALHDALG